MLEAFLITLAICAIGYAYPNTNAKETVIRIPTAHIQDSEYNVAVKRLRAFTSAGPDKGMVLVLSKQFSYLVTRIPD
jgi:hypothetical protein